MKSILIIGMGRFGRTLAYRLQDLGNDVMIVDKDTKRIEDLAPDFTDSFIGDCTVEAVVRSLGVSNFQLCLVTIGENFQASLEITSLLKELGAQRIVAKASRDRQAKFLRQIGADEVIFPELDYAEKLAKRYNADHIFDFIEVDEEFAIYEIAVLPDWVGRTITEMDVRRRYRVNIIAVKSDEELNISPEPSFVFSEDDKLLIIGTYADITKLSPRAERRVRKKKKIEKAVPNEKNKEESKA